MYKFTNLQTIERKPLAKIAIATHANEPNWQDLLCLAILTTAFPSNQVEYVRDTSRRLELLANPNVVTFGLATSTEESRRNIQTNGFEPQTRADGSRMTGASLLWMSYGRFIVEQLGLKESENQVVEEVDEGWFAKLDSSNRFFGSREGRKVRQKIENFYLGDRQHELSATCTAVQVLLKKQVEQSVVNAIDHIFDSGDYVEVTNLLSLIPKQPFTYLTSLFEKIDTDFDAKAVVIGCDETQSRTFVPVKEYEAIRRFLNREYPGEEYSLENMKANPQNNSTAQVLTRLSQELANVTVKDDGKTVSAEKNNTNAEKIDDTDFGKNVVHEKIA